MKRFSKTMMTLVAVSLLSVNPVWADTPGKETAAPTAQEVLSKELEERIYALIPELKDIPVADKNFIPANEFRPASWFIHFTDRPKDAKPDDGKMYTDAHVELDAKTGTLISMHLQNPKWLKDQDISKEMAKEKAVAFVNAALGDKAKDYQVSDNVWVGRTGYKPDHGKAVFWSTANVSFERLVNGIPFGSSQFQVEVDADGRVVGFYWDGNNSQLDLSKFPSPSEAIKKADAEKAFLNMLNMKLQYNSQQPIEKPRLGEEPKTKPVLLYQPDYDGVLDARTGKKADLGSSRKEQQTETIALSAQGKTLIARTADEAAKLLKEELGVDVAGLKLQEENDDLWMPDRKYKQFTWRSEFPKGTDDKQASENMKFVYVGIDTETGEILNFNYQDESKNGKPTTVSIADAKKKAIAFLEAHLGSSVTQIQLQDTFSYPSLDDLPSWVDKAKLNQEEVLKHTPPRISFFFTGLHQGIPVIDQAYWVEIDGVSGNIVAFGLPKKQALQAALPDSKGIVSADEAKAQFLKEHPLRLEYIWPEYYGQKAPAPMLVYVPTFTAGISYIDAFTGKTVQVE